jgi:hypothetical protein
VIEEYERKGWMFVDYTVSGDELRVMILHQVTGEKKTLWFMSGAICIGPTFCQHRDHGIQGRATRTTCT